MNGTIGSFAAFWSLDCTSPDNAPFASWYFRMSSPILWYKLSNLCASSSSSWPSCCRNTVSNDFGLVSRDCPLRRNHDTDRTLSRIHVGICNHGRCISRSFDIICCAVLLSLIVCSNWSLELFKIFKRSAFVQNIVFPIRYFLDKLFLRLCTKFHCSVVVVVSGERVRWERERERVK